MHPYVFINYNPHYIPLEDQPFANYIVPHENPIINVHSNIKEDIKCKMSSKKDRHSKIDTARGPRDRRMRLSLDVAKKFFKLQDMLGFDKASNTIEWLIMKSKPAIRDLLCQHSNKSCSLFGGLNSASSCSECEVVSGSIDIDQSSLDKTGEDNQVISVIDNNEKMINKERKKVDIDQSSLEKTGEDNQVISVIDNNEKMINKERKKVDRGGRKSLYINHTLAKETREKARARARKRTFEKRNSERGSSYTRLIRPSFDQNTNRLGSWVPFGENQVDQQHEYYPSSHIQFKQGENSWVMSNNWMPSLFNSLNNHEHHEFQI